VASNTHRAVRLVAFAEAAKGVIVLLAGFGLLSLIHHDLQHHAEALVRHLHLNPASHLPKVFLDYAERLPHERLAPYVVGAAVYVALRFVEAWGLWKDRAWAEWLAAVSGGVYLPVELYEMLQLASWPRVTVFVVNLGVVAFMVHRLGVAAPVGPLSRSSGMGAATGAAQAASVGAAVPVVTSRRRRCPSRCTMNATTPRLTTNTVTRGQLASCSISYSSTGR
jgi:uncharacterized membrane protein (DUF2068 family)